MMPPRRRGLGATDWASLRRRVEAAADGAVQARSDERRRATLEARARALATPPAAAAGEAIEVLEFELAGDRYAIGTQWVGEVLPLRELTRLPGAPAFVLGIIPLRGDVVSVLDLKVFFELPARGLTDLDKVIVLDDGAMRFAILADRIVGVRELPLSDVQPPLATLADLRAQYLVGVTGGRGIVLDGGRLLADPAILVGEEAER